ncbi:DNA translocase FtsK [Arcicella sp. DC2W]|uniref:DNA translocase FtsK n=1 Tax=Arcicella gelida TaxID=2984195 RepID=A0ABU5SC71_9BACT|nr:DNA translocase FtsK [Arcicella sp. DC2W]MEA5406005.1 DNA translocase FtsK [Arcicella sp. DC2W]
MARNIPKNTEKTKERNPSQPISFDFNIKKILQSEQLHFVLGILFILLGIFMFFSFSSHLFTGDADQSEVEDELQSSIEPLKKQPKNPFGLYGAKLAHLLLFRLFGWSAFLLVPILLIAGYKLSFKKEILPLEKLTWQSLFYMIWLSTFLGFFVFMLEAEEKWSNLCGGIGYFINEYLYGFIGWASFFVISFVLIVFVVYYYKVDTSSFATNETEEDVALATPESETAEENIAEAKNIKRVRANFETILAEEEPEEELAIDREDNFDEANIRPFLPPIVETPSAKSNNSNKGAVALTIENSDDIPEVIEDFEDDAPMLEINESVNDELVKKFGLYDPMLDLPHYKYPILDLMKEYDMGKPNVSQEELKANSDKIVETLANYGIGIASIKATIGPTVTLYEIIPDAGVRISKIKNLEDDIALSLAALGIRIIAPIPGKGTIGIEVPNKNREMVPVKMVIGSEKFQKSTAELPIVLGKTISNDIFITDLAKMPHLLMAGATGQGKSVGLNMILTSLLYKKHPSQLKFVLVDPKKVELTLFNKIERHFLAMLPNAAEAIITDTKKVVHTLNSLCIEMDNRYNLLKDAGCRNLKEYNVKFVNRRLNPDKGHYFMPYIVLIIDELADLMMTAGKDVEQPIARLAQLARAIGIHLVVATQRPSVNVITGTIKANFPARLSFKVTSKIDSRTILDTGGAEQLVGQGDMLLSMGSDIIRLQCAFVDTPEVEDVCEFIGNQQGYDSAYMLPEFEGESEGGGSEKSDFDPSNRDQFFDEAARLIVTHQQGSTSLIQRRLKLGYNRAGRLIDQLEAAGIVGQFEGSKAREVLIKDMETLERHLKSL